MNGIQTLEHKVAFDALHFDFTKSELHLFKNKKMVCTLGIPLPMPGQTLKIEGLEGFAKFNTAMGGR